MVAAVEHSDVVFENAENSGWRCIAEYEGFSENTPALARKFIFGTYLDEPLALIDVDTSETIYYYHQNRLYNVVAMTDSSGNVVERYTFSAYGLPLIITGPGTDGTWGTSDDVTATASAIGNPYLYTGQRWDPETENHYYKNRYQRPTLGRFISRDSMEYIDGMNMYEYVAANPSRYRDPYGYGKEEELAEYIGNIEHKTSEMLKAKREMAWREQMDNFDPNHEDYKYWQKYYEDNKKWRSECAEGLEDLLDDDWWDDDFGLSDENAQALVETLIKASEVIAADAKELATAAGAKGLKGKAAAALKGRLVGLATGEVMAVVGGLDGFGKSDNCKDWYKEGMAAIRKAGETGDESCCLKLRADPSENTKGGNCALDIGDHSGSGHVAISFARLSEYLERKCKVAAKR